MLTFRVNHNLSVKVIGKSVLLILNYINKKLMITLYSIERYCLTR